MKSKRAREAVVAEEDRPQDTGSEQPSKKRKTSDGEVQANGSDLKKPKKDKKDKKDKKKDKETRKEKKDKRKDLLNLPGEDVADEPEDVLMVESEEPKKYKGKKDKKKEGKTEEEKAARKAAKKAKKAEQSAESSTTATPQNGTTKTNGNKNGTSSEEANGIDLDAQTATKRDRHIVFVGNLPFSATAASISAHFASLSPIAVRCLTNKGDSKPCKGIAFVEFGSVSHQRTCLDKFHHSMFEDGVSPARKINVELTAGGGGKTQHRTTKIAEKNKKLDENRAKRIEKEKNEKAEGAANGVTPSTTKPDAAQSQAVEDWIHPSRRGRVPGRGS